MNKCLISAIFSVLTLFCSSVFAQETTPTAAPGNNKVWSLAEAIAEKSPKVPKGKVKYCSGGRFAPCVCYQYVSREVKYRPAFEECGGAAGILFGTKYTGIYSAVVRDGENRDRWPETGFGGCTPYERDTLGLNKCSAFKVQDIIKVKSGKKFFALHCLGASGYSTLFKRVTRITAKLSDSPDSNEDPLVRWCLQSPKKPLN